MAVTEVTDNDFQSKVLESKLPIVVDFWATWCGPCRMAEPVLDELSDLYEGKVNFVKIDIDKNQLNTQKFQVMSIPTTIFFKQGKEIARQVGFAGKEAFEEMITKNL